MLQDKFRSDVQKYLSADSKMRMIEQGILNDFSDVNNRKKSINYNRFGGQEDETEHEKKIIQKSLHVRSQVNKDVKD